MLQELPLLQLAKQSLSAVINDVRWELRVFEINDGLMAVDIGANDKPLISGVRAMPGGAFLLPYEYQGLPNGGNFVFTSDANNAKYPHWRDFGVTCRLYYVEAAEAYAGV